jgi:predicted transcriptional regulator
VIIAARQEGVTVSRLMRELLDKSLAKQEKKRTKHMYTVLKRNRGAGEKNVTDASTTIDEILYGEKGA